MINSRRPIYELWSVTSRIDRRMTVQTADRTECLDVIEEKTTQSALITVAATGQTTLFSSCSTVDTNLSTNDATFYLELGINDSDADATVTGRCCSGMITRGYTSLRSSNTVLQLEIQPSTTIFCG